jgi:hypothetical protein
MARLPGKRQWRPLNSRIASPRPAECKLLERVGTESSQNDLGVFLSQGAHAVIPPEILEESMHEPDHLQSRTLSRIQMACF